MTRTTSRSGEESAPGTAKPSREGDRDGSSRVSGEGHNMKIRAAVSALVLLPALGLVAADGDAVVYGVTDQAGDANAINDGQTLGLVGVDTMTTPVQAAEADILGGRIVNVFDDAGAYVGVEFRTALSADPVASSMPLIHRFRGAANGCEFWIQAETGANNANEASVRLFGATCGVEYTDNPVDQVYEIAGLDPSTTVRGEGLALSWDEAAGEMVVAVDLATVDARVAAAMAAGGRYSFEAIAVRGDTGVATVPVIDQAEGPGFRRDTEFTFGA